MEAKPHWPCHCTFTGSSDAPRWFGSDLSPGQYCNSLHTMILDELSELSLAGPCTKNSQISKLTFIFMAQCTQIPTTLFYHNADIRYLYCFTAYAYFCFSSRYCYFVITSPLIPPKHPNYNNSVCASFKLLWIPSPYAYRSADLR